MKLNLMLGVLLTAFSTHAQAATAKCQGLADYYRQSSPSGTVEFSLQIADENLTFGNITFGTPAVVHMKPDGTESRTYSAHQFGHNYTMHLTITKSKLVYFDIVDAYEDYGSTSFHNDRYYSRAISCVGL
jgi:hypothetical protein